MSWKGLEELQSYKVNVSAGSFNQTWPEPFNRFDHLYSYV